MIASRCARSSAGSASSASQRRPATPKRSLIGAATRLRCRIACAWLRSWVCWRTSAARCATSRRSRRVRASGTQTSGMKSAASSCARTRASTLSVLIFASAMALVRRGFETTTRPAWPVRSSAMAQVFIVASRTTWSSLERVCANVLRAAGSVAMRRRASAWPGPRIATSAKLLCTSSPMVRMGRFPFGHPRGHTTPTDTRSRRNRVSRRGGQIASRTRGP